jgi:hypothetical protein
MKLNLKKHLKIATLVPGGSGSATLLNGKTKYDTKFTSLRRRGYNADCRYILRVDVFICSTILKLLPEPVFVDLLRSPGIDFQPGGPVRQPYLSYRPATLHRPAESIPGLHICLQIRAPGVSSVLPGPPGLSWPKQRPTVGH